MRKEVLLAAATVLAFTAPAAAACLDHVAELEERLARIEAEAAGPQEPTAADETVDATMSGGQEVELPVDEPEPGTEPPESWFGSPPASVTAEEQLQGARDMAAAGDEAACMEHAAQAERIIVDLEE